VQVAQGDAEGERRVYWVSKVRGKEACRQSTAKLHNEADTKSREQNNLMKEGEMRTRSHEGLKN